MSVQELAVGVAEDLDEVIRGRPYVLFGHSMGGAVAFELARLRQRRFASLPSALIVSGRGAPGRGIDRGIRHLNGDGLVAEMMTLDGTDARVLAEPDLVQLFLPSLRADYTASETYQAGDDAVVDCDIVALAGSADPYVDPTDVALWKDHTRGRFGFREFAGGHFFCQSHEADIAEIVAESFPSAAHVGPAAR
jgi:surfactin synthase thioesterase subunit